jgi:hypothetical protein
MSSNSPEPSLTVPTLPDGEYSIEEVLTWAYRVHEVDRRVREREAAVGAGDSAEGFGLDSIVRLSTVAGDGRGGLRRVQFVPTAPVREVFPAAEAIHLAVLSLERAERDLVMDHARAGSAPNWLPHATWRCAPVMRRGRVVMLYDLSGHPLHACKVRYLGVHPEIVSEARAQYAAWFEAVSSLSGVLRARLAALGVSVSGPASLQAPWEGAEQTP